MRVFLPAVLPDQDSPISSVYDDAAVLPPDAHPNMATIGFVPAQYIGRSEDGLTQLLLKNWRDALPDIIAAEEGQRIARVFPLAAQVRAALAAHFGSEANEAEIKRGWDYLVAVRACAKALRDKRILDPCADANWPKSIDPVEV